ncbi:hypothetical protein LXL04_000271 [Taraxacum kok-saghyz]
MFGFWEECRGCLAQFAINFLPLQQSLFSLSSILPTSDTFENFTNAKKGEKFPLMFALDKRKKSFVSERLVAGNPAWDWRRANLNAEELSELDCLTRLISGLCITNCRDPWRAKLAKSGD